VGGLTATARPSSAATARHSWTGAGATFPDGGVLASFSSRTIAAEGILGFSLGDLDGGGAGRNNKGCGSGLLKGQGYVSARRLGCCGRRRSSAPVHGVRGGHQAELGVVS
jgi:hypothetical protein